MFKLKQSLAACAGLALVIALVALVTPTKTQGQGGNQQPLNVRVIEQPLTVRVIETPRQAFHHNFKLAFGVDQLLAAETFTVPAGKQLVLTYASASVVRSDVKVTFAIQVLGGTGFVRATHYLVPAVAGPVVPGGGPSEAIVASEPLHLYIDAGQTVVGRAVRDDSGGILQGDIDVSGYLVDVPQ